MLEEVREAQKEVKKDIQEIEQECKDLESRGKECVRKIERYYREGNHVNLYFQYRLKLEN